MFTGKKKQKPEAAEAATWREEAGTLKRRGWDAARLLLQLWLHYRCKLAFELYWIAFSLNAVKHGTVEDEQQVLVGTKESEKDV